MLLKEIDFVNQSVDRAQQDRELGKRGMTVEIVFAPDFQPDDAEAAVKKLGGNIIDKEFGYLGTQETGKQPETILYDILFTTIEEAEHAKKILRRLRRGLPNVTVNLARWSVPLVRNMRRRGVLSGYR